MPQPEVSIVIPTYNEATYIDRLLEALTKQSFQDFEVIVSDAESKDGTKDVIKSFAKQLDIKFIEAPPKGPGYGRNQGAKHARGEWLLFLDADDDFDDKNFLEVFIRTAQEKNWGTASTRMKANTTSFLRRFGPWFAYQYQRLLAHTKHPVAQGYCILTRKKIFEEFNGFNEKIHFGEDFDYVSRAGRKYGFGFVDSTYYYVDLRRGETEGIVYGLKCVANEFLRHGRRYNLENNPIKYEFGKHKKRQR